VVIITPWPLYPQGKNPWCPLTRRLSGPPSRSGRGVEEKIPSSCRYWNHRSSSPALYRLSYLCISWRDGRGKQINLSIQSRCRYKCVITKAFRQPRINYIVFCFDKYFTHRKNVSNESCNCEWCIYFILCVRPYRLWGPPGPLSGGCRGLFSLGWGGRGVKLATHLPIQCRGQECVELYLRCLKYAFMAWCPVKKHYIQEVPFSIKSRDSSVGIVLGYGLDDRGFRFLFPSGAGNFFLHHRVQNGSGAHPALYPVRSRGSFPRGKAVGACSWPLTSI
jgi:hypothetical protein